MANEEHLSLVKDKGVLFLNQWRRKNPQIQVDLSGANLCGIHLNRIDLSFADLRGADLVNVNFSEANLQRANLSNANLKGAYFNQANLLGAVLRRANFFEANFHAANLNNTDIVKANLNGANLNWAKLIESNLRGAYLVKASLRSATIINANLSEVDISEANFNGANLKEVNLKQAIVGGNSFGNIDLRELKGLDTVNHRGPSTIGIDTIHRSRGNISKSFLRGCGLSDLQIKTVEFHNPYLTPEEVTNLTYDIHHLIVSGSIQYHSSFISYSNEDNAFVERLYDDLQDNGVRCWFAPEDLKIGERFRIGIDESIRIHDKLLLILSEHSVASDWVEQEVEAALEKEREQGETVLFPIRLDEAVMETKAGWPALVKRTRHIGDFRQWKDYDAYQKALERLLRDLKFENKEEH